MRGVLILLLVLCACKAQPEPVVNATEEDAIIHVQDMEQCRRTPLIIFCQRDEAP